ncbi:hypothetical protein B0H63DRAFT_248768 [Podospora didyma]|uniref:Ubiquitin-like protease family profile domain-containing protein n=1 Tax=Podospora didyma TaxID=330526 RepID=A0AAE0KLL5_9PEZI|nr:hypothetical protein B0H63DRAFT_248768 [Podospora didyma]
MRGAYKMPPAGGRRVGKVNVGGPITPINTLEAPFGDSVSTGSPLKRPPIRPSSSRVLGQPPTAKRLKVDSPTSLAAFTTSIFSLTEDIEGASVTERNGSQGSLSHSGQRGVMEFQYVEGMAKNQSRGSRRPNRRNPSTSYSTRSHPLPSWSVKSITPGRDEIADDSNDSNDELAHESIPNRHSNTARMVDAADHHILGISPTTAQHPHSAARGKKRQRHAYAGSDEQSDELMSPPSRQLSRPGSHKVLSVIEHTAANRPSDKLALPREDLIPVRAAVCQQNYRYAAAGEGGKKGCRCCYFMPVGTGENHELRAVDDQGNPTDEYTWLKITPKTQYLYYHPKSTYIKVTQPSDIQHKIGATMVLEFRSLADARQVIEWAKIKLGKTCQFVEYDGIKLRQTFEKTSMDATKMPTPLKESVESPVPVLPPRFLPQGEALQKVKSSQRTGVESLSSHSSEAPDDSRSSLRNKMLVSAHSATPHDAPLKNNAPITQRSLRTRQMDGRVYAEEESNATDVVRWSETNTGWESSWKVPLVIRRTTVDKDDIQRLDDGQCLNDNLIMYGLRYLFEKYPLRHKDLNSRVYMHNSFFYTKLRSGRSKINYDGVKSWTAKVDLLAYDYIIVPVNEHYHWWVAIICNPGKLDPDSQGHPADIEDVTEASSKSLQGGTSIDLEITKIVDRTPSKSPRQMETVEMEQSMNGSSKPVDAMIGDDDVDVIPIASDLQPSAGKTPKPGKKGSSTARKYSPEDPRIITLDSLDQSHSPTVGILKQYLIAEFADKRNKIISETPQLGMRAVGIPQQDNFSDCGVYLLGYIQEFVKNPDRFVHSLLRRETPPWKVNSSELRTTWRDNIFAEQKAYQDEQLAGKKKKRATKPSNGDLYSSRPTSSCNEDTLGGDVTDPPGTEMASVEKLSGESLGTSPHIAGEIPKVLAGAGEVIASHDHARPSREVESHVPDAALVPQAMTFSPLRATRHGDSDIKVLHSRTKSAAFPTSQSHLVSARPQSARDEDSDEVVLLQPRGDTVMQSTETQSLREKPVVNLVEDDEPILLQKLPSTSPTSQRDVEEVHATPSKIGNRISVDLIQPSTKTSRTKASHTSSTSPGRIARGLLSPYFSSGAFGSSVPVVERAKLVRPDPIVDLTNSR